MMAMATIMTMTMTKGERGKGCGVRHQHSDWEHRYIALFCAEVFFRYVIYSRMIMIMLARMIMMMTMEVLIPCSLPCICDLHEDWRECLVLQNTN